MNKDVQVKYMFHLMKEKDPKGFELLYENYFRQLYGIAFLVLKDEGKSHDTIQNVMIRLYQLEAEKFPEKSESTWLYRVTKNEALQILRKQKVTVDMGDIPESGMERSNIDDFVDMQNYQSLIEPLNEKQRSIVTLKVLGGLKHSEIANLLSMPVGTVQWIYNTSIKKLRVMLSGLSIVTCISGGVFANRVMKYINGYQTMELESQIIKGETIQTEVPGIYNVTLWGIVFLICFLFLIVFFIKSDIIPTSKRSKCI